MSETVDFICILLFSCVVSAAVIESAKETVHVEKDTSMEVNHAKEKHGSK